MPTEAVIIALIGTVASIVAAIVASRAQARVTATGLYVELCKSQQERIAQLTAQIKGNEAQIKVLSEGALEDRQRIDLLEADNKRLQGSLSAANGRIATLEEENQNLRNMIKLLQKKPRGASLGPTV